MIGRASPVDATEDELLDRDLVEQAQRGDRDAFAVLARTRSDRLMAIAHRILRVLVFSGDPAVDEIYDPIAGTWTAGPPLAARHGYYLASTLLADARILLVAGGQAGQPAPVEIYDPATRPGAWTAIGTTVDVSFVTSAVRLATYSVLVIGSTAPDGGEPLAELFTPG